MKLYLWYTCLGSTAYEVTKEIYKRIQCDYPTVDQIRKKNDLKQKQLQPLQQIKKIFNKNWCLQKKFSSKDKSDIFTFTLIIIPNRQK